MAYLIPQPPPAKPRPGAVSGAVILLWVVAGVQLVSAVLAILPNPDLNRELDAFVAEHPDLESARTILTVSTYGSAVIELLVGVALAVLAVFVRKGSQPARVVTWVLGGLITLCSICLTAGSAFTPSMSGSAQTTEAEELNRILSENLPAWLGVVSLVLTVVTLLALIAVIILLALPASNDFFRKEQEVWVPPTAGGPGGFPQVPPPATPQNPLAPPPPPPAPPGPNQE